MLLNFTYILNFTDILWNLCFKGIEVLTTSLTDSTTCVSFIKRWASNKHRFLINAAPFNTQIRMRAAF